MIIITKTMKKQVKETVSNMESELSSLQHFRDGSCFILHIALSARHRGAHSKCGVGAFALERSVGR